MKHKSLFFVRPILWLTLVLLSIAAQLSAAEPTSPGGDGWSPSVARRKQIALAEAYGDALKAEKGGEEQRKLFGEVFDLSREILGHEKNRTNVWIVRASAALMLNESLVGWEAARNMIRLGLESSEDELILTTLSKLERRKWTGENPPASQMASSGNWIGTWSGRLNYEVASHNAKDAAHPNWADRGNCDSELTVVIAFKSETPTALNLFRKQTDNVLTFESSELKRQDTRETTLRVPGNEKFKSVLGKGWTYSETGNQLLEKETLNCPELKSELAFDGRAMVLSFGSDSTRWYTLVMHSDGNTATVYYDRLKDLPTAQTIFADSQLPTENRTTFDAVRKLVRKDGSARTAKEFPLVDPAMLPSKYLAEQQGKLEGIRREEERWKDGEAQRKAAETAELATQLNRLAGSYSAQKEVISSHDYVDSYRKTHHMETYNLRFISCTTPGVFKYQRNWYKEHLKEDETQVWPGEFKALRWDVAHSSLVLKNTATGVDEYAIITPLSGSQIKLEFGIFSDGPSNLESFIRNDGSPRTFYRQ